VFSKGENAMSDEIDADPIGASIALMEAQISKLRAAIETLEGVRPLLGQSAGTSSLRNGNDVSFSHDAFFGMSAADAAKKYLAATKKTATIKAIADALLAGGWKTAAKNVNENLRTILSRTPAFVLINGQFGLAEWYPGRKVKSRRSSSSEADTLDDTTSSEDESSSEGSSSE
jgi:hypothetical protein